MKGWKRAFIVICLLIAAVFGTANLYFYWAEKSSDKGRPYRVEARRIALQIEKKGFESVDLRDYKYICGITRYGEDFFVSDFDYIVCEAGGELYRLDYITDTDTGQRQTVIVVNLILCLMSAVILGAMLYVRNKILSPFQKLSSLPYELSKGNLTVPLKENKSRFFGKFTWGMDMLRENMEQQKQRELNLQKEKKTLLLSLSHDIKTPLSAIKLYSKALSKNLYSDPQKQREIAESIDCKADEIEGYVNQIINASKEDFLSIEVTNSEFYLEELVLAIKEYYIEKLSLVKTDFKVGEYENQLIFGDFNRSLEVLQNIIENAVKYGDGKKIEILFSYEEGDVLVTVRNSGCTLRKEELPHIFESFQRGSNSKNVRGSGLGLYICRQIMHKMKGEVFAETEGDFISVTAVFRKA